MLLVRVGCWGDSCMGGGSAGAISVACIFPVKDCVVFSVKPVFFSYLCGQTQQGGPAAARFGGGRKVRATQSTVLLNGKISARG